jgi:hypothetical protein
VRRDPPPIPEIVGQAVAAATLPDHFWFGNRSGRPTNFLTTDYSPRDESDRLADADIADTT